MSRLIRETEFLLSSAHRSRHGRNRDNGRSRKGQIRRLARLGNPKAHLPEPNEPNGRPPVDLDAILALLSDEQRAVLAARLDAAASSDVPTDARSEDEPHERLFLLLTKQFLIPYLERGRRGTI